MKLSRLIQYLEHIQKKYGDMEIEGNVLCGERMEFASICVEDGYAEGYVDENDEDRFGLLLELETYDKGWKPTFRAYEYPSNKDITLE